MRGTLPWFVAGALLAVLLPVQALAYDVLDDVMQKEFEVNNAATVFRAANYESLDGKISGFASYRATTNGGDWYLTSQYDGLARVVDEALGEGELDEIESQARDWIDAYPKSASSYLGYATIVIQRGARAANGGRLATSTVAQIRKLLTDNQDIVSEDPHYHAILVRLAIAEGAGLATLKPILEAAAEANPSYSAPWVLAAEHLITNSADGAADLEAMARLVLDETRTVEGSAQYARIYQHALEIAYGTDIFKASKVSWFDLKAGISVLSQRFPYSGLNANEFALMACLAGDQVALRPLIKLIEAAGRTPPASIWGDLSFFEKCRSWAVGQATAREPLRPVSPMAIQLSMQRLAFDPKRRLTAAYEEAVRVRMRGQLSILVYEDGFRTLESLSEKYRSTRSRTPSGISVLWTLYSGFRGVYGPMIEENYDRVSTRLESYLKAFPDSPTPIVLKVYLLTSKAWLMRDRRDQAGNIDAFAIKASNKLFEEARAVLEQSKAVGQRDPAWFTQMIGVGDVLGWPADRIDALVEEGAKRHPGYFNILFAGLDALMRSPQSQSRRQNEIVERYARRAMTLVPKPERSIIYARIYWHAEQAYYGYHLFEYTTADWPDMRRGFEDMVQVNPGGWNQNAFAYFSCLAGDAAKLRELLPVVASYGEEPPWDIWKMPELRNACLEFARSAPVEINPAPDASAEQNPT